MHLLPRYRSEGRAGRASIALADLVQRKDGKIVVR
jgi:hypothetical protein